MRYLLRCLPVVTAVASGLTAAGCHAQSAERASAAHSAPQETRHLRDFGAVGDGRADDTAALQRAFANSGRYCLDGEGRSYRVHGTLRVQKSLCLRNVTLIQSLIPFDTRPYINHTCPVIPNASAVIDCGDPAIPAGDLELLRDSLSVRTLFIRPAQPGTSIKVFLDRVKVDRGRYPEAGSRIDSAGIWLEGADGADLHNVEITGDGKGVGLFVFRSRNVNVENLWVHDLLWAPYPGDAPLSRARTKTFGWNSVPIHEFRDIRSGAGGSPKFYGVRVQEQITCALFSEVAHVSIRNAKVSRCMAQFQDGGLPWQADGLDVTRSSSDVAIDGAMIDSTWEGMDIEGNGSGLNGLTISNADIGNSFGFGLKLGRNIRNARISNVSITNAGIAGIVMFGPVDGVSVSAAQISGVGVLSANGQTFVPWPAQSHSGIVVQEGPSPSGSMAPPHNISLENISITRSAGAPAYQFGVVNKGGVHVLVQGLRATGFSRASVAGVVETR